MIVEKECEDTTDSIKKEWKALVEVLPGKIIVCIIYSLSSSPSPSPMVEYNPKLME